MRAKLIAFAQTRRDALEKLGRALDDTSIFGLTTNQAFPKLIELPVAIRLSRSSSQPNSGPARRGRDSETGSACSQASQDGS